MLCGTYQLTVQLALTRSCRKRRKKVKSKYVFPGDGNSGHLVSLQHPHDNAISAGARSAEGRYRANEARVCLQCAPGLRSDAAGEEHVWLSLAAWG
jgi:hypothetical protein